MHHLDKTDTEVIKEQLSISNDLLSQCLEQLKTIKPEGDRFKDSMSKQVEMVLSRVSAEYSIVANCFRRLTGEEKGGE